MASRHVSYQLIRPVFERKCGFWLEDPRATRAMLLKRASQIHFSWAYLFVAVVWAVYSLVVFSQSAIHALHDTTDIDLGFPGKSSQWIVKGDGNSFERCGQSLCLKSASANRSSLVMNVPVDTTLLNASDYFMADIQVSTWDGAEYIEFGSKPSVVYVSPLGLNQERYRSLPPMVFLKKDQSNQHYRAVSAVREDISALRLIIVVRSTGAWKVHSIQIHAVQFSALYKSLRWAAFGGWILILVLLMQRLQTKGGAVLKLISGAVFFAMLFIGVGKFAPIAITALSQLFVAVGLEGMNPVNAPLGSWQVVSHILLHLIVTLYLLLSNRSLGLTWPGIVALNLVLAIGIESVQMGIPGRAAELGDIGLALSGMAGAFVLFLLASGLKRIFKPRQDLI